MIKAEKVGQSINIPVVKDETIIIKTYKTMEQNK